jgi:hypothetical protein
MAFVIFLFVLIFMSVVVSYNLHIYAKRQDFINLFFAVFQCCLMVAYIVITFLKNVAVG